MTTLQYEKLVANMPPGLERATVQVLRFHVGLAKAIKRADILRDLAALGYTPDERQFRLAVHKLRKAGWLIASLSSTGYFFAETRQEYDEFRDKELTARLADLTETRTAMDAAARQRWGDAAQIGLL